MITLAQPTVLLLWLTLICPSLPCTADTGHVDLFYHAKRQKFGYMNELAQVELPAVYEEAEPFDAQGMARVRVHGKYGFIDRQGHWVVPANLESVGNFAPNGLAAAYGEQRTLRARLEGILFSRMAWGYIDRKGNWAIEPLYLRATKFGTDGIASVRPLNSAYVGLMNADGEWAVAPTFGYIGEFGAFGLAPAQPQTAKDATRDDSLLQGFINSSGKWVIPPSFDTVYPFAENGLARTIKDKHFGYIDLHGRWAVQPQYINAADFASNGLAPVENAEGQWTYIDARGKTVIPGPFAFAAGFTANGYATVYKENAPGVIDSTGKWILAPRFEQIGGPSMTYRNFGPLGLMSVVEAGKDRVINLRGQFMPEYDRYNAQVLAAYKNELGRDRKQMAENSVGIDDKGQDLTSKVIFVVIWAICWYILTPLVVITLVFGAPLYFFFWRKKRRFTA